MVQIGSFPVCSPYTLQREEAADGSHSSPVSPLSKHRGHQGGASKLKGGQAS